MNLNSAKTSDVAVIDKISPTAECSYFVLACRLTDFFCCSSLRNYLAVTEMFGKAIIFLNFVTELASWQ